MFQFIGGVLKYTALVLLVLVLSHIIQIQGVTISQHVLNTMHKIGGYDPKAQANRITTDFSRTMQTRLNDINKIDEISTTDQKQLNRVIQNSQNKRK